MKQKVSPIVFVAVVVALLGGVGIMIWRSMSAPSDAKQVIVAPENPNDPKFHPNKNLGLGGT